MEFLRRVLQGVENVTGFLDGDRSAIVRNGAYYSVDPRALAVFVFDTRTEFAAADLSSAPDGSIFSWLTGTGEVASVRKSTGATTISDLSGFEPIDPVYPDHWGQNTTPGTTSMAAAVQSWADYGGKLAVCDTTYLIDETDITEKIEVYGHATFKRASSAGADSDLLKFSAGAEGSIFMGLIIDGDRTNRKSEYDTENPTNPGYITGWREFVIDCDNVHFDVTVQNACGYPFVATGDRATGRVYCTNHGSPAVSGFKLFSSSGTVTRPVGNGGRYQKITMVSDGYDNDGSVTVQHAIDVKGALDGQYVLDARNADGDTSGSSDFLSGITIEDCTGCEFRATNKDMLGDNLKHVGFAFQGNVRCNVNYLEVFNQSGVLFESNACRDCIIVNPMLDGNYRGTTEQPVAQSRAMSLYRGTFNAYRSAKGTNGGNGITILGGYACRCGEGPIFRDDYSQWIGGRSFGHLGDGVICRAEDYDDYFALTNVPSTLFSLDGCHLYANGRGGIRTTDGGVRFGIRNCQIWANGQDTGETDLQRSGVYIQDCDAADIVNNTIFDDQGWTVTDGASFEPTTATQHVIKVKSYDKIYVGQQITLVNGTGAGDATGKVIDMGTDDDITVEFTSSTTLSSTSNTSTLTGTWTQTGTALAGSGGAATTEVTGQVFVTDGSEWRWIVAVASNNAMTLNQAFTTPPSADTLDILEVNLSTVKSQRYGVNTGSAANNVFCANNNVYDNDLADYDFGQKTDLRAGSNYFEIYSVSPTSDPENLATDIPPHHMPFGIGAEVTTDLSGGGVTSWRVELVGTTLTKNLTAANTTLTAGEEVYGARGDFSTVDQGTLTMRLQFGGGAPTAGAVTVRADYQVVGART